MSKLVRYQMSSSRYYPWVVLAVLSILYLLENFDRYLISVSVIPYIDYSSYEYSLLVGPAFTIIYAIGGLVFSLAHADQSDGNLKKVSTTKFGVLFLSTLIFSVAFGLTTLCQNFWQQVIVRIVMGLAQSVITPFSASMIRNLFPPEQCGFAFSIFNTGTYLAFSMSLSLGIWIYDEYGWKAGYLLFGIVGSAVSLSIPVVACWSHRSAAFGNDVAGDGSENIGGNPLSYNPLIVEDPDAATKARFRDHENGDVVISFATLSNHDDLEETTTHHSNLSHESLETIALPETSQDSPLGALNNNAVSKSTIIRTMQEIKRKLYDILVVHWWQNPSVMLLVLATGVRLGAGYIWSAYTGPFFSGFFVKQDSSISCSYSYSAATAGDAGVCSSSDYPYCVSGTCSAVSQFPWHNEGMDPLNVIRYMSWVPLMGSALGNLVGGLVSDKIISGDWHLRSNTSNSEGTPQQRVPLRAMISGASNLLALPIVIASFYLKLPSCFLIYIASGILGEVYLSQTLALITEKSFIPPHLITPSVALFVLITTAIGGNATLLVPLLQSMTSITSQSIVTLTFAAATTDTSAPGGQIVDTSLQQTTALQLQDSLVYSLGFCYALSGLLYLWAYWLMARKQRLQQH